MAQLDSHAMGELRASREPVTQWDMKILATSYPGADQLRLGSTLRLEFRGDEWEDDGWRDMYLIGITGDGTRKLTLEVQEI